jgi:hypothetical protein
MWYFYAELKPKQMKKIFFAMIPVVLVLILNSCAADYKITPTRLTASGKGEFFPKDDNTTPEGRARNRRTEIILSPKLDELMKLLNI